MQDIQNYEMMLNRAFSVNSPDERWNIFSAVVQQLYIEIQKQGRSLFYERCLSCYHNGITPFNKKLARPGWFSRNALNIVFAVDYLLRGQSPDFLRNVMTTRFGSLNNLLRDNPAQQEARYAAIFYEAQAYYNAHIRRTLAVQSDSMPAETEASSTAEVASNKESYTFSETKAQDSAAHTEKDIQADKLSEKENIVSKYQNGRLIEQSTTVETLIEQVDELPVQEESIRQTTKEVSSQSPSAEQPKATAPVQGEVPETEHSSEETPAESISMTAESTHSIPSLLLPLLAENQAALNDSIHIQKQLSTEIAKVLSTLRNPFSPGTAFQRQQLSALNSLVTYQEECNRILLSNLSRMESALGTAQWQGFVEIAAMLDEFSEKYNDSECRRPSAMWGDIRAIRQKYTNQLHRQGIEPLVPQSGDAFDEELHELFDDAEIDIDNATRVTKLYTRGYRAGDTIFLRAVVDADSAEPSR